MILQMNKQGLSDLALSNCFNNKKDIMRDYNILKKHKNLLQKK